MVAVEREIKFAPQTHFSPAISRYREHGRLTNSQLRFRTTARFKASSNRTRDRAILFSAAKLARNECELLHRQGMGVGEGERRVSLHRARVYARPPRDNKYYTIHKYLQSREFSFDETYRTYPARAQINFWQIDMKMRITRRI